MNYYVVMPNGQKYGPADLPTVNQWIREGRVSRKATIQAVEEFESAGVPPVIPNSTGAHPNPAQPANLFVSKEAQSAMTISWVLLALSVTALGFLANVGGLIFSARAEKLGHPHGAIARKIHLAVLLIILAILGFALLQTYKQ